MTRVANEVRLFAAMATFGLVAGTIYWFVSYEPIGTVLLGGFGLAAGIASIVVWRQGSVAVTVGNGAPHSSSHEPVPAPGWAPIGFAVGAAGVALGAAFGPWLTIAGLLVIVASGRTWLTAAMGEAAAAQDRTNPDAEDLAD
jgi:hypothetical protein